MLPAVKVLLVTALIGGGTVGTYALAGGKFGTGGSGNGNTETTAQVSTPEAARPASPAPAEVTPPKVGSDSAVEGEIQRGAGLGSGGPSGDKEATLESGVQSSVLVSGGDQGQPTDSQTSDPVDSRTRTIDVVPEGKLGSEPTGTQVSKEAGSEANGLNDKNTRSTDPNGTPTSSNPGATADGVENTGDGAKGTGQGTVTASGGDSA